MSGGSGCQQIKLFVLRPGFGTLSLLSSFLPLSPCISFFSSLFLFSQYFFFPFNILSSNHLHCLCWTVFLFPFLFPQPHPSSPIFYEHVQDAVWWDWSLLMKPVRVFIYVHLTAWWHSSLLMKPVKARLCACSYLYVFVVHGAAWWDRPLLMKLQSQVSADLSSLPEERQMHCSGGRETAGREGAWKRQKSVLRLNPH